MPLNDYMKVYLQICVNWHV